MVEFNNIFKIFRLVVFGLTSLFAFIVLILGGLVTHYNVAKTDTFFPESPTALAIATALFTLLSLPLMVVLSLFRKGAITSMIAVEIGWTGFLWIMWLAVGASSIGVFASACSRYFVTHTQHSCNQNQGIIALGFINWIFLLFYNITLVVLACRHHLGGNTHVWTMDVTETNFNATGDHNSQGTYDNKANPAYYGNQYPPGAPVPVAQPQAA